MREAPGIHRVLAHHREMIESAGGQGEARNGEEQGEKKPPAATRTTLLPGGVSAFAAVATAKATTMTPRSAASSRTRALATHSAASAVSVSKLRHATLSEVGRTSSRG